MKTLKVKIDNGEVTLSKLPLGKYAELLKAIKELPKHVEGLKNKTNEEIMAGLPVIIGESLPDVIGILTIATPLKADEVEQLGLDEVTRLVIGVIEVNSYKDVYDNLKKALARPAPATP
jgi:hypothetical protein